MTTAPLVIDHGDVASMLASTLLVLMMIVPGLALFYGGMVRSKNLLSMLSQVIGAGAIAMIACVGWAYSLAFTEGGPLVGSLAKAGLAGIDGDTPWALATAGRAIPELLFASFQLTFAAITAALVVGATAERMRFAAAMLFALLFVSFVYAPIAHMVWASDGFIFKLGAIDFAGGTVVHVNAGVAGLVAVLFVGRRSGFPKVAMPPHNLALALLGTGLLWVGWFGFNAGSALEASGLAAVAMLNTLLAPAAGILTWMAIEARRAGKPSLLGGASGAIAGLVAVTPAAGISGPLGAMLLGVVASGACYSFITKVKHRAKLDDSLDVFGIHGVGGIVGSIATAVVALPALGGHAAADYALTHQLWVQAAAVAVAAGWSGVGSAILLSAIRLVARLRPNEEAEREGLDLSEDGESAYN